VNRTRTLGTIALCAVVVALVATVLARDWLWSVVGNRALQSVGSWLTAPMRAITFLGDEKFYLVAIPLVYWCIHKGLGADLAALLVISGFVNGCLKSLVKRSRPFWEASELRLSRASSFSTPSGHAQSSAALYGYLAWFLARGRRSALAAVVLALLAALVALSRVPGVHFPATSWGALSDWRSLRCAPR
jgi:membrane-associated phospholipid phosphatase